MIVPFADLKVQYYSIKKEIDTAINSVVESAEFIGGRFLKEFEQSFAAYVGAKYCTGISNGTTAIEAALRAAGVGHGDEVITVPHTFIASAESITAVGATPIFVDVDKNTGLMDATKLKATSKTKAILPVHLYGQSCDMDPIIAFAKLHGLVIIEDCAQAHGATYDGKRLPYAGFGTFSFYPGKNLGAYGDAGAVVCNDAAIYEKLLMLRDHGRRPGDKYIHTIEAYNYRMDSIQAAILSVKLKYIDSWTELRKKRAAQYKKVLSNTIVEKQENSAVYHLFVIRHPHRDKLQKFLKEKGISTGIHYPIPLHLQSAYKYLGHKSGDFPVTEKLANTILSLPMFPEISEEQVQYVCEKINEFEKPSQLK